jgi:competence ComEA-like helix-hairpin-helix protein
MKLNPHYFTKQEQRGLFIIVVIILLIGVLRWDLYKYSKQQIQYSYLPIIPLKNEENNTTSEINKKNNSIQHQTPQLIKKKNSLDTKAYLKHTTPFDPNLVDEQQLTKMKFPKQGINNLIKYRNKNGVIKSVSHFKNIWGFENIDSIFLDSMLIFTKAKRSKPEIKLTNKKSIKTSKPFVKKERSEPIKVLLNQADTAQLKRLNGIGPYRARKIIEYRDLLGGFYSIDQLKSVYWLPDSVFYKIKTQLIIDSTNIKALPVNTANLEELVKHPYINYSQAKIISNYILEHGPLEDRKDLFSMRGLDSNAVKRLLPYFSVNEQ